MKLENIEKNRSLYVRSYLNPLKVAIVDRGVEREHSQLKNCNISGITVRPTSDGFQFESDWSNDTDGHGTAIAAIILGTAPGVELVSVKLDCDVITEPLLCAGVRWCLKNSDIQVINISLGVVTSDPSRELYNLCKEAYLKGVVVVAAAHPTNRECYPAFFSFVFGVGAGMVSDSVDYRIIKSGDGINVLCNGSMQKVSWKGNAYRIKSGSSFAAAHFTGVIAKTLSSMSTKTYNELFSNLISHSNLSVHNPQFQVEKRLSSKLLNAKMPKGRIMDSKIISPGSFVAMFPLSGGEFEPFLEDNPDMLDCRSLAIDYPTNLSKRIYRYINRQARISFNGVQDADFETIDLILLGDFLTSSLQAIVFAHDFVHRAVNFKKKFVVWNKRIDDFLSSAMTPAEYERQVTFVNVERYISGSTNRPPLPKVDKPVLSIVSLSSNQDKLRAELKVFRYLKKATFRPAYLSSSPIATLLDSDIHHFVLQSKKKQVSIPHQLKILSFSCDQQLLIASPSKMGFRRKGNFNIDVNSLKQLQDIRPDAVIMVVRALDDISEIEEVWRIIQSVCVGVRLVCVCLSPSIKDIPKMEWSKEERILCDQEFVLKAAFAQPIIRFNEPDTEDAVVNAVRTVFS